MGLLGANKPVIRIARIAGQFANRNALFQGNNVNGFDADPEIRKPDPSRLVSAYFHSAATLNYLRASLSSGLADLHSPLDWGLGHIIAPAIRRAVQQDRKRSHKDALRFMRSWNQRNRGVKTAVTASHEGLSLEYEQTLTRNLRDPIERSQQNIGSAGNPRPASMRRRLVSLDRSSPGIANPIGIKIGPSMAADKLVALLNVVNPRKEIGKVTLISRYGASKIAQSCPATPSGVKTRHFTDILAELKQALEIHRAVGSFLGGVPSRVTGEAVTECVGGAAGFDGMGSALELAFLVAGFYREGKSSFIP
ncbi:hypothetical protein N7470_004864 [Penicillium chermesinum]|nr:hypothetical protein N7470_004864 [Penicillium chermesinum]